MNVFILAMVLMGGCQDEINLINYFITNRTSTGLILDRESDKTTVSVAATGFGIDVWAIACQKGILEKQKAVTWINQAIDFTVDNTPTHNKGWLYHFTDIHGNPKFCQEVSSIDSAIFYLGAKQAALRLREQSLITKVNSLINKVDVQWMITNGGEVKDKKYFSMGFHWTENKPKFLQYNWDEYSEGIMLYKLFNITYEPKKIDLNLPLFVYYFPLCFEQKEEQVNLLKQAVNNQIDKYGVFGFTACDGPNGYAVNERNVISPLAIWGVEKYIEQSTPLLKKLSVPNTTPSINLETKWISKDRIGIDDGSCLILRNN